MKPPRTTIRTLLFTVVLVALNAAVFRFVLVYSLDGLDMQVNLYCAMSVLPMASFLILGLYRRFSRRNAEPIFLAGFEAAGLSAVLATAYFYLSARWGWELTQTLDRAALAPFERVLREIPPFGEWIQTPSNVRPTYAIISLFATFQVAFVFLFTLPQLIIAIAGGALARLIFGRCHLKAARSAAAIRAGEESRGP